MPLKPGRSQKVISQNIKEFHHGATYERTKEKNGKNQADKQAIAVALSKAGKSTKSGHVGHNSTKQRATQKRALKHDFWG